MPLPGRPEATWLALARLGPHLGPVTSPAERLTAALADRYRIERELGAGGMATVYLATAPKSNRSYAALGRAMADVQDQPRGEVPLHLRDAHYKGAASLGHGKGYEYPHDDPRGWLEQDHRPDGLQGRTYYEPSTHGAERRVAERMAERSSGSPGPDEAAEEEADERE